MTNSTLTPSLTKLATDYAAELAGSVWFTPHSRSARRVLCMDDHEVWVLGWLPGQGTDLHDHGGARRPAPSAFAVASGALTEYTVVPGSSPRLQTHKLGGGEVSTVDERTIHAVRNNSDAPAVSVHVYAPRLELMRRYLFDESGLWLASAKRAGEDW